MRVINNADASKLITMGEAIDNGTGRGRTSANQISYSERGNLQGNQSWASAGVFSNWQKPREWVVKFQPTGSFRTSKTDGLSWVKCDCQRIQSFDPKLNMSNSRI